MRRGFSLIELMVACLLLGMLVTALTMLFNSSAVAWRTGVAGVAELKDAREELGTLHNIMDDLLPGLGQKDATEDSRSLDYRVVSVWDPNAENQLRTDRAFTSSFSWGKASKISISDAKVGARITLSSTGTGAARDLFVVGVRSAGPDRQVGTKDDITSWPGE